MPITRQEASEQIVFELGNAVERATLASACLSSAYELLGTAPADRLEDELFRPVQKALGRAKRARARFAESSGVPAAELEQESAGLPSQGVKALVEKAIVAAAEADHAIAELQDSMMPIEFGDAELRADLAAIRELLDGLPSLSREFLRTLGR